MLPSKADSAVSNTEVSLDVRFGGEAIVSYSFDSFDELNEFVVKMAQSQPPGSVKTVWHVFISASQT